MTELLKRMLAVAATALAAAALVASGSAAPARQAAGTMRFCSDITYPPEEFYMGTKPAGSDIDIGTAVAKRLGKTAKFDNTGFDGIIAALQAKKCDAVISGMNDTPERRKQVAFVDYIKVGQSFMVESRQPEAHHRPPLSLRQDGVGRGGNDEQGLPRRSIQEAQGEGEARDQGAGVPEGHRRRRGAEDRQGRRVLRRLAGRRRTTSRRTSRSRFGGAPVNPIPVGIAIRKSDTALKAGVQRAINAMYRDGTMKRILAKWKMSAAALKK